MTFAEIRRHYVPDAIFHRAQDGAVVMQKAIGNLLQARLGFDGLNRDWLAGKVAGCCYKWPAKIVRE